MKNIRMKAGQAIVETALMATLLFFLLSAAFDLGLIFFAYQAAANAALEGASYASLRWPTTAGTGNPPVAANRTQIIARVRNEPGTIPNGIISMRDLNSDGTNYNDDNLITTTYTPNSFGRTVNATCNPPTIGNCDASVTVSFIYRPFFVLAPTFGAGQVQFSVTRIMPVRDVAGPDVP